MKILIAEDNPDDRKLLKINLEHHGCEVIEVSDGEAGLEMAKAQLPNMIISDALMPHMDGFQFLRSVKKDATLKLIPFVFYSAVYTGEKEAELALSLGAEAFIVKPKDPQEFWEELIGILEERKLNHLEEHWGGLIREEEDFLKRYSDIVASKLEEKVRELAKARAIISESEECYRNLFSSLRDVILTADTERKIMSGNQPALRDVFGYELEEIISRNSRLLYEDDDNYNLVGKKVKEMSELDARVIAEAKCMTKSGRIFTAEISLQKLKSNKGEYLGYIAIIKDITEKKKLEENYLHAQKMESIGILASGIAHDFNNILSVIIGFGHLALMDVSEKENQRQNIENLLEAADRATYLTKDLLLFSRKQPGERHPVDLNKIILNLEKFLQRVIGAETDFKTVICKHALRIFADSHQLEQVLMNLATNARDAMSEGGCFTVKTEVISIDEAFIAAYGYGKAGPYAVISVSDTGSGMDETTLNKIFDPFFTTKQIGKGTGLGLSVVFGIIKQHEGFINVESKPGQGTTFRIYLPIIEASATEEIKPYQEEIPARGTETILLAEDNEAVRKLSYTVLNQFGYTVIEAVDGRDALKKFSENKDAIQLLLFDLIMPKMNGKDAYDEIKKIKSDVKVIFVSGYAPDIVQQKTVLDNAFLLYKPVSPLALLRKIRSVLDKKNG